MNAVATRPSLEVADILRAYGEAYDARHPVSALQAAVMQRLARCRTAALGGHIDACDHCGYRRVSYNSCRDRHCPKCQARKRAEWLDARLERLLPVEYFHVVFTVPADLHPLMLHHPKRLYDLLFRAASQSLLTLAADPKRLGAQIGVTAILHTWGQNLSFHPHLHCVVTGGGLSQDGSDPDLCPQPFRIGGQGEQALGSRAKEQVIEPSGMMQHQGIQGRRQSENDVEVFYRQQSLQPTAVTGIDVSSQGCRAATGQAPHYRRLQGRHRMGGAVCLPVGAENVRDLQGRRGSNSTHSLAFPSRSMGGSRSRGLTVC